MTIRAIRPISAVSAVSPIPNNLGPTLLIALGVLLLPLGIGLPLLLLALARVRTWQGQRALPRLHRTLQRLALRSGTAGPQRT